MSTNENSPPQQPIVWSVFYHLLPGVCVLVFYLLISPWVISSGFQPSFGVILGFVVVGIPLQLFIMLREGYRQSGRYSLARTIFYKSRIPFWQYLLIVPGFILYAMLILYLINPISTFFMDSLFSGLPEWFRDSSSFIQDDTPGKIIIIGFVALFLVDGIANPVIEELYFRGFLMPRISRYGAWTPFINAALFAFAHFWQPWNILQIFILVAPLYYLVWRKRSIYISIVMHCTVNLIGAAASLGYYLSGSGI